MAKARNLIITLGVILLTNLIWTTWSYDYSPLYMISSITNNSEPSWAIRGEIGDMLSGHFSALAFLAVAYSIILQNEANKQMRESIKLQSDEIKLATEESTKQTEEFFINNMNVKLDRYYKLLEEKVDKLDNNFMDEYSEEMAKIHLTKHSSTIGQYNIDERQFHYKTATNIYEIINHIYRELEFIKTDYIEAYRVMIDELYLRIVTDYKLMLMLDEYIPYREYLVTPFIQEAVINKAYYPINPTSCEIRSFLIGDRG